ncbi:MAG: hypothetical protein Q9182_005845 [Xanthomendoza sp. 2 TL-2023]
MRSSPIRLPVPPSQQTVILNGITTSTCGLDIACVCRDDKFLTLLQAQLAKSCDRNDQATTLSASRDLCVAAIPSLAVESRGGELVATVTVMMIIASIAVLLRLYARRISAAKLGKDDYLIIVALIFTYGLDIISFYAIKAGIGRHMITLNLDQVTSFVKTDQATQVLFGFSITATKLSILFFYNRLFPFRTFHVVSLITIIASILWWVGVILTSFLHCRPFAYYWDRSIPGGYCVNDNVIGYTITSFNIVTDLVVLVLPIPWLWGMNMAVPKRMAVVGLFVLGSFVCIAGIIRLPFLSELQLSDITYTSVSVGVWISVECNIGILSACLPILRPLFSTKYSSSPVARLTRIIRSITNSRFSSSSRENLTTDPEKGSSEPSSDTTVAEGLKWPNDSITGGWKWSRNNSCSNSDVISPIQGNTSADPVGSRRTVPLADRERKQRTWYTAAAEMLPEIDLQKRWSRKAIDADLIPRYRDDDEKRTRMENARAEERTGYNGNISNPRNEKEAERSLEKAINSREKVGQVQEKSRKSSHGGLQLSIPNSAKQSKRSSLGRVRDTWNLMPSVVLWDRSNLVRAMNLR